MKPYKSPLHVFTVALFTALFFTDYICLNAQNYVWAKGEGGIGNDAASSVTVDELGNTYITGNIAGEAEFSGANYQGKGVYDIFIAKYSSTGTLIWIKTAGGNKNDLGNSIKYKNGSLFLTGYFTDTAYFENTTLIGRGETDGFVAKYDINGNLNWVQQMGSTNSDFGSALDVDDNSNIFISGKYETSIYLGNIQLTTSNIYNESFYASYDVSGNLRWAKTCSGTNSNLITGIAYGHNQSIYICGFFRNDFTLEGNTISSSTPSQDIFIGKLDVNGNLLWLKKAGGPYEDAAHGITADDDGNPSLVGYFFGTAYFDNNTVTNIDYNDVFVAHYDVNGNNQWVHAGKGQQLDIGYGITSDAAGNIYATGMFQRQIDFDGQILTGPDREIFVVSYNKQGGLRWAHKAGNTGTDCGLGIASHPMSDKIAVCGYYLINCTFGTIAVQYADANDLFVAVYDQPFVNGISNFIGNSVLIYPNPCSAGSILVNSENNEPVSVKIYTLQGQLVLSHPLSSTPLLLQLPEENGTYLVETVIGEKTVIKKIIKL